MRVGMAQTGGSTLWTVLSGRLSEARSQRGHCRGSVSSPMMVDRRADRRTWLFGVAFCGLRWPTPPADPNLYRRTLRGLFCLWWLLCGTHMTRPPQPLSSQHNSFHYAKNEKKKKTMKKWKIRKNWKNEKNEKIRKRKMTKNDEQWKHEEIWLHTQNLRRFTGFTVVVVIFSSNSSTISMLFVSECVSFMQNSITNFGVSQFFRRKVAIFIGRETKTHILQTKINEKMLRSAPLTLIILLDN